MGSLVAKYCVVCETYPTNRQLLEGKCRTDSTFTTIALILVVVFDAIDDSCVCGQLFFFLVVILLGSYSRSCREF